MAKFSIFVILVSVLVVRGADKKARDLGVRCNGRNDDTAKLNEAIASLGDGDSLELPANAICPTTNVLIIDGKKNIRIFGSGEKTEIRARRQVLAALLIRNSVGVVLENFRHHSPSVGKNIGWSLESCGIFVNGSSSINISNIQISKTANIGILVNASTEVTIDGSTVEGAKHHGILVHGASKNVIVQKNTVRNIDVDGITVIDWQRDIKNNNIKFLNNIVQNTNQAGIRVATAENVEVRGNKISDTFRAGIQLQCAPPSGNGLTNVLVTENEITNCPRVNSDDNRWDSAIVGTTNLQILEHIYIQNNKIVDPKSRAPKGHDTVGIRFSTAGEGYIQDLNVLNNEIVDTSKEIQRCVSDPLWFSIGEHSILGNKLNGGSCPENV